MPLKHDRKLKDPARSPSEEGSIKYKSSSEEKEPDYEIALFLDGCI